MRRVGEIAPSDGEARVGRLGERGHRPARFAEEVTIRRPTEDERRFLQLATGTPVLVVTRAAYDRDDTPVEAAVNVLDAFRWSLVYEWQADEPSHG